MIWFNVWGRGSGHAARVILLCMLLLTPLWAAETASSVPEANGEAVIFAGQEELLATMLGRGATLPDGCTLANGDVDHQIVKATYTCPGGEVVFQLAHPQTAAGAATRTKNFAITLLSGSPPAGLAPALESLIRAHEDAFHWTFMQPPAQPASSLHIALAVAGLLVLAALGWALRRRTSTRQTQLR